MIRRRIEQELDDFWTRNAKEALLVSGARQVGKTFIVREFARRRFKPPGSDHGRALRGGD